MASDKGNGNTTAVGAPSAPVGYRSDLPLHLNLSKTFRDRLARFGVTIFFGFFGLGLGSHANAILHAGGRIDALNVARMLSCICLSLFYTLIVLLTLARGFPVKQASGLQPRASAILGTFLIFGTAFLPAREGLPASWHFASAALSFLSSALLLVILSHLGRSFSIMPEARHLVTSGPYAFVRHPLYLAEEIGIIAIFMQILSIPAALLLVMHFSFQVRRIHNEEVVLAAAFPEYPAYQARTARLIPGIW